MRRDWPYETCAICTREQGLAWSVSDADWYDVMGNSTRVVCLECFLKRVDDTGYAV